MLIQLIATQMVGVCDYILHGIAGGVIKDVSYYDKTGYITYTLSADKSYTSFFQVCTGARAVDVSHTKICKMSFSIFSYNIANSYEE